MKRVLVWASYLVAVAFACGTGVLLGRLIRDRASTEPPVLESDLAVGMELPDVLLVSAAGESVSTRVLLKDSGRVLVFLDPHCPACKTATLRWQKAVAAGKLEKDEILGISTGPTEETESYRSELGLTFPVYRDVHNSFRARYKVAMWPYEVVVGRSRIIRSTNLETHRAINLRLVRSHLAS